MTSMSVCEAALNRGGWCYILSIKCHVYAVTDCCFQFLHEMPYLCGNNRKLPVMFVQAGSDTIDSLNKTRYYWFITRKGDIMFIFLLLGLASQLSIQSIFRNSCLLCCYFWLQVQGVRSLYPWRQTNPEFDSQYTYKTHIHVTKHTYMNDKYEITKI